MRFHQTLSMLLNHLEIQDKDCEGEQQQCNPYRY